LAVGFLLHKIRRTEDWSLIMSQSGQQSRFENGNDVVVMKFGGTSVENTAAIERLTAIVHSRINLQPVLVVSALAKVTDQLLEAGKSAADGKLGAALALARDIFVRHECVVDDLVVGSRRSVIERELRLEIQQLESALVELDRSREFDPRAQDHLLGFGESLSSFLVTATLCDAGLPAVQVDARECIITDARHGQASPLWDETNQRLHEKLVPLLDHQQIPVLGGFIASTVARIPTTLGRGGSDFSATIVGAALGAIRVEIWTDVDGVMTTDPKLCPEARVIRKMSFEEAAELAQLGAKVLHPGTLAPAILENIPVYVLNSRRPESAGTEIAGRARSAQPVSAITTRQQVAAVEVESVHAIDSDLLSALFAAFDAHACPVHLLGTSLGRVFLIVGSTAALPKIAAELESVAKLRWENHRTLVCLVGENIRRQPEIASRAFAAVSDLDVRVACQGASDRVLSFLVEESKAEESVCRLHSIFFPAQREPARDWGGSTTAFCQAG
jgi:aspartate kinase